MITLKLHIKNKIDIQDLLRNYTGAVHFAYKSKTSIKILREKFGLDSQISRDALNEADGIRIKMELLKKEKSFKIVATKTLLETETAAKTRFNILRKIARLERSLTKDYVFGSREKLSKYNQAILRKDSDKKVKGLKKEYRDSRLLPFYSSGDKAFKHGNRKFTMDIENNRIVFMPFRGKTKYEIEIRPNKKWKEYLTRLQNHGDIPITYKLRNNFIYVIFDLEKLNAFHFDKIGWSSTLKHYPKSDKNVAVRKLITKQFYADQDDRKAVSKLRTRYMSVDLNPQVIGWTVLNRDLQTVSKGHFNLSVLGAKLKLSSTDKKQVYQGNKRRDEISLVWKSIFKLATHYKVANFVIEELNFKPDIVNTGTKEFNRKVRGIWHRTFTIQLINKYCQELGIKLIEVNPVYSSFIGNIKNKDFDPVSASQEICRRGIFKFKHGGFYPVLNRRDRQTMASMLHSTLGDLDYKTIFNADNWKQVFALFKQAGQRYRREFNKLLNERSFKSHKSKVTEYRFCYAL